jgi:hypothetical protein
MAGVLDFERKCVIVAWFYADNGTFGIEIIRMPFVPAVNRGASIRLDDQVA